MIITEATKRLETSVADIIRLEPTQDAGGVSFGEISVNNDDGHMNYAHYHAKL